ncbi:tetratricopeptide repeat protein [Mailhella sp.]|uniref:tetratricopeptide repeat protein n=1 Tax=Mailhella sp. TaxID=1981029 RepID=UPI003AB2048A
MTDSSRRVVLVALALGIGAMFALSVAWRMGDHPLVRQKPVAQTAPANDASRAMTQQGADSPQGQAIMSLMQAMKNNPNDVNTLLQLASLFAEQGNVDGAKDMAQRALVAAPSDHRPPYLMGVLLSREGAWADAAAQLERSIAMKDDAATRYSLAVLYRYHLGQEDKARANYEAAAKICDDPSLASMIKAELDK